MSKEQPLCKCGHDEEAHRRTISGTNDKACTGVKLFDDTVKKLFDDEERVLLEPEKSCCCKKCVTRPRE
jgi:hypothetical protein